MVVFCNNTPHSCFWLLMTKLNKDVLSLEISLLNYSKCIHVAYYTLYPV